MCLCRRLSHNAHDCEKKKKKQVECKDKIIRNKKHAFFFLGVIQQYFNHSKQVLTLLETVFITHFLKNKYQEYFYRNFSIEGKWKSAPLVKNVYKQQCMLENIQLNAMNVTSMTENEVQAKLKSIFQNESQKTEE